MPPLITMARRRVRTWAAAVATGVLVVVVAAASAAAAAVEEKLMVDMTLVPGAASTGAVCLDGSPPAYHLHQGSGAGAGGWLLQFEGGGWCNDERSCAQRARTPLGSSRLMNKLEMFSGLLSNDPAMNPGSSEEFGQKLFGFDGKIFSVLFPTICAPEH